MSKDDLYAIRKKYREEGRKKKREYTKAATSNVLSAASYPQRKLKETISGDESQWFSPEGMNPHLYAAGNTMLDLVADPLNFVGAGLVGRGLSTARKLSGPQSLKGNALSSAPNRIPNFYGPSGEAQVGPVSNFLFENQEKLPGPLKRKIGAIPKEQDAANLMEKITSFGDWAMGSAADAVANTVSPSARATYRTTGINRQTQNKARQAQSGVSRDERAGVAQAQANTLIADQAGRKGPVSPDLRDIQRRSYLTEPTPLKEGTYTDLVQNNNLQGTYAATGKPIEIPKEDLDLIDEHIRTVWKGPDGKPIGNAEGAHIRIKASGAGANYRTGNHLSDFANKSKVMPPMKNLFKDGPLEPEDLWKKMKALSDANRKYNSGLKDKHTTRKFVLSEKSDTWEKAQENGVWITGSFVGDAITEGGVNYVTKVNPSGRIMTVVSDEHNFLEKVPGVGTAVTRALPNRSLSATAPMIFDATKKAPKTTGAKIDKPEADTIESLDRIAKAKPSKEALRAERQINTGAGMITGRALSEDEE